jgi:hypothetical protein
MTTGPDHDTKPVTEPDLPQGCVPLSDLALADKVVL